MLPSLENQNQSRTVPPIVNYKKSCTDVSHAWVEQFCSCCATLLSRSLFFSLKAPHVRVLLSCKKMREQVHVASRHVCALPVWYALCDTGNILFHPEPAHLKSLKGCKVELSFFFPFLSFSSSFTLFSTFCLSPSPFLLRSTDTGLWPSQQHHCWTQSVQTSNGKLRDDVIFLHQ